MKNLHVAKSPITNRIFCGSVLKDGMTWASNKTDVTGEACAAVAQHVLERGEPVVVTANGEPEYEITVRSLRPNAKVSGAGTASAGLPGYAAGGNGERE
ncbi:hypothetical protein [Candidatus Skiveiella danica]|uniref:DUF7446 family protein n=1 Tax=Candidatus Skiveiella danica TaxID=3386177 RepID=UPI0039B8C870